ncbi:MAG TPA: MmgE/PrpD family protein [Xanthobacteraceae bacterium]|nr:MmgE/PrpD family protein [Xanthobacteraceae bacterium]
MDNTTTAIARFASSLRYEQIPSNVSHAAKQRLVDSLACAIGGYNCDAARIGRRVAKHVEPGSYTGRVLGFGEWTTAESAAFINTAMVRYLDFNDAVHGGHPSDALGGILAVAPALNKSGKQVLTALVVAYEIITRLITATGFRERGWDQGFAIGIGSAAGHCSLLGLSQEATANAVAIAAINVPLRAARAGNLSIWKGAATAHACRDGVFAAELAAEGMTGPEATFEGRHGLFEQITGEFTLEPLGDNFRTPNVGMKYWPVENTAQASVWAALDIKKRYALDDIETIDIATSWAAWHEIGSEPAKWDPQSRETADHSLPYIFARALVDGTVNVETFEPQKYLDPKLRPIMAKIQVREDPEISKVNPGTVINLVTVTLKSGAKETVKIVNPRGHMKNLMDDHDTDTKFLNLAESVFGKARATQMLETLWSLDNSADVLPVFKLFDLG